MPRPCAACGDSVHERAARCPHCGASTGFLDMQRRPEEALAELELARRASVPVGPPPGFEDDGLRAISTPTFADAILDVVEAAVSSVAYLGDGLGAEPLATAPPDERAPLPRAVARIRPPTIEPLASEAPEPALPPADQPRFLK